jgi:pumilio RNA-binding family
MSSSGLICEVACSDEHSARFIQQRLRSGTVKEKNLALTAALAELDMVWRDQYGHLMLEGLIEFGSNEIKTDLMDAIYKCDVVALCMHGNG